MKTVKKYKTGKRKGYNIRQLKNGKFVLYNGNGSLDGFEYDTFKEAADSLKYHCNI